MMNNKHPDAAETAPREFDPARILYLDSDCVVVNKLIGEAVEGAGPGMTDLPVALDRALREMADAPAARGDALKTPAAVHRLDVPVTGCALFARSEKALAFLNAAFAASQTASESPAVQKLYWAIIEKPGKEIPPSAEPVHWIQFDSGKNKSTACDESAPGRRKAIMKYSVAGEGTNYLFLNVELITGRHHQIRCQFERLGLHIKGDLKYGARRSEVNGGIRLHARSLSFPNPSGGSRIFVQADPPELDNLWRAFPREM